MFKFPNIDSAAAPPPAEAGAEGTEGGDGQDAAAPADDGFTPEQRRKIELEDDPGFKKYKVLYRNKIPLIRIRDRIKADGLYKPEDIDLFATPEEIKMANDELQI